MLEPRTVDLGEGRSLHFASAGKGPDVVLVHGALGTCHDWSVWPCERLVRQGCRVTVIDRPGHGRSRRRRFQGTPRDQARHIREGLAALGAERPVLVGHSYGCLVSLAYAELFPESVSQLVLVAPLAFPEPRLVEHMLLAPRSLPFLGPALSAAANATIDRPALKFIQRLMFAPQPVPPEWESTYPYEEVLDADAMVREGEDAAAILPMAPAGTIDARRIESPTHILTGKSDRIVDPGRQAGALSRSMPNARLTQVEGVGHMLHHARPDLVLDAVREALAPA